MLGSEEEGEGGHEWFHFWEKGEGCFGVCLFCFGFGWSVG